MEEISGIKIAELLQAISLRLTQRVEAIPTSAFTAIGSLS
jgi:hypothetical protein